MLRTDCAPLGDMGFVAKRRSGWACIGNPKVEQETIEGTKKGDMGS